MKRIFLASSLMIAAISFAGATSANTAVKTVMSKGGDDDGGQKIPASAVPAPVMASFNAQFPTATNVKWEKEKEHGTVVYKADFLLNGKRWRATYTSDGTLIKAGPR